MKKIIFLLLTLSIAHQSFCQNWDINTLRSINLHRNISFDNSFKLISNSVGPIAFGVPTVLFAVGCLKHDSTLKYKAIYIGSTVVVASIISTVSKKIIKRPRPFVNNPDIVKLSGAGSYSMPSGHTSDAFALATSVSVAYPKWYIIAASFGWAGAVGYSRMDLGVHYPSDVIVGAIVGSGSAYLSHKLNKLLFSTKKTTRAKTN